MPKKLTIHPGERYGRLTIIAIDVGRTPTQRLHRCRCDCGNELNVRQGALRTGNTKSCGCLNAEQLRTTKRGMKHGLSRSPEYLAHKNMRDRCYSPNDIGYMRYGGRGIRVCDRWLGPHGFENFYADVGPRPSQDHSLGRIDNDGNYEPGNVEWQTRIEQGRNQSTNRLITFRGVTKTLTEWANDLGTNKQTIIRRLEVSKWPLDRALTEPVSPRRPRAVA